MAIYMTTQKHASHPHKKSFIPSRRRRDHTDRSCALPFLIRGRVGRRGQCVSLLCRAGWFSTVKKQEKKEEASDVEHKKKET